MPDAAISVAVGALSWSEPHATYHVEALGLVDQRRRRVVVTAPDVHGVAEVASVLDEGTYALTVRCCGASWAAAEAAKAALVSAASARSWTLTVTVDGVTESWLCRAADWSSPVEDALLWSHMRRVTLRIPVAPVSS